MNVKNSIVDKKIWGSFRPAQQIINIGLSQPGYPSYLMIIYLFSSICIS